MSIEFGTQRTNAGNIPSQPTTNSEQWSGKNAPARQDANNIDAIKNETLNVIGQKALTV